MGLIREILIILVSVSIVIGRQGFGPVDQEWGYVTVRPGAHLFWWLYKTTASVKNYTERPLIIWLQGGPGASSTGFGNFIEIGPLDLDLKPRNTTWIKDVNVLFVDNPVGAGFSYVDDLSKLAKNKQQIAEDFLVLLQDFYRILPELKRTPLYIFGESYGGKMAAEIALYLDRAIKRGVIKANLKGICLGDPWISLLDSTLAYAPYLLSLGAVDYRGYEEIQYFANLTQIAVNDGDYTLATSRWMDIQTTIENLTYSIDLLNTLTRVYKNETTKDIEKTMSHIKESILWDSLNKLMNNPVKTALRLNSTWCESKPVYNALYDDLLKSATHTIETLLNTTDIKIAIYNGELDLIVNILGTMKWINKLRFPNWFKWEDAPRVSIEINGFVEGYVKKMDNLAMYWAERAGHIVPSDNPTVMDFILSDITDQFNRKNKL